MRCRVAFRSIFILSLWTISTGLHGGKPSRPKRITGEDKNLGANAYSEMLGKWPRAVRLQFSKGQSRQCGGTLISKNLVLTAAHCVAGFRPSEITVFAGDVHTLIHDPEEQMINAKEIIVHHLYHQMVIDLNHCNRLRERVSICVNDVALILLDSAVSCKHVVLLPWGHSTISVMSRRFPSPIDSNDFGNCYVAGWGSKTFLGPNSDMLRGADVSLMSPHQCNSTCRYDGSLLRGMLCATGDGVGGQDACTGDSGGPLMCTKDRIWRLVGVVSWGHGCGDPSKPGVYADVGYYQEWILSELILRPSLEAQFWNSVLECNSPYVQIRECFDPWNYEKLRHAGIRCRL